VDVANAATRRPASRRTLVAWVIAIVVVVLVVGGVLAATNDPVGPLTAAQRAHAIALQQFDALPLGPSPHDVVAALGKAPFSTQRFTTARGTPATRIESSCIYYYRIDEPFGQGFQFCFDDGALSSKLAY
jgi:hypothetical protein